MGDLSVVQRLGATERWLLDAEVSDADGSGHTYWVDYSPPDGGETWVTLAMNLDEAVSPWSSTRWRPRTGKACSA